MGKKLTFFHGVIDRTQAFRLRSYTPSMENKCKSGGPLFKRRFRTLDTVDLLPSQLLLLHTEYSLRLPERYPSFKQSEESIGL